MNKCETCGRSYEYKRGSGTRRRCNSCLVNDRRFKLNIRMLEYKGGACLVCGYSRCKQSLDFHHVFGKKFSLSGAHCRSWQIINEELDKCVLLCKNCHGEVHAGVLKLPEGAETKRWEPKGANAQG